MENKVRLGCVWLVCAALGQDVATAATATAAAPASATSTSATSASAALAPTARWSAYSAGRAQTPPMGWSTWNAFGTDISEARILGSAQKIVDSGLARLGYRYINIDDGWALRRQAADGRMAPRPASGRSPTRSTRSA
jgi:alpha-galactosidase